VLFGLTRGEILLVVFIFLIVYCAGLLPKLAARLGGTTKTGNKPGTTDE